MNPLTVSRCAIACLSLSLAGLLTIGCANHESAGESVSAPATASASTSASTSAGTVANGDAANAGAGADPATVKSLVLFEGPITGFGSVIINGVRFNDESADIRDDEDSRLSRADLRIGTMVRLEGATDSRTGGAASKIRVMPSVRGRVDSIDTVANGLTVLGQRVVIDSSTVSDGITPAAPLKVGDWVVVHGVNGNAAIAATLVERTNDVDQISLRGVVSNLNRAARTFNINALSVSYANAVLTPESIELSDAAQVTVRASVAPQAGVLVAARIRLHGNGADRQGNAESIEFKGIVESTAQNGGAIIVSGTTVLPANSEVIAKGGFVIGQRVQIKGRFRDEILIAERVTAENPGVMPGSDRARLLGTASNRVGKLINVNGVEVDASEAAVAGGSIESLPAGTFVEVNGATTTNESGMVVRASSIRISKHPANDRAELAHKGRKLYGAVYEFVSISQFKINGVTVDASGARLRGGDATALCDDLYLEISGQIKDGLLVASEVEFSRPRSASARQTATATDTDTDTATATARNDTRR